MSTAERLKSAALALFAEQGYEATSLSQVAGQVGIRTPSIYAHFESKEALFLTLIEQTVQEELVRLDAFIQSRLAGSTGSPGLAYTHMHALFLYFTDHDQQTSGQAFLKRILVLPPRALQVHLQETFMAYEEEIVRRLREAIAQGVREGVLSQAREADIVALFFGLTDGLLVEHRLYSQEVYRQRRERLWHGLWRSIR